MAVPSYEEVMAEWNVESSLMEKSFSDDHLIELSSKIDIDVCELLALKLGIPRADINGIMNQRNVGMQPVKILECWRQRRGIRATYKELVQALLGIRRTDLAEIVVALVVSSKEATSNSQTQTYSGAEFALGLPPSPASSSGIEDMSPSATMSPLSLITAPRVQTVQAQDITSTLTELEKEFLELVIFVEATIESSDDVGINTITRRFSMLPQSIKRRQETDENYRETRQRILNSTTIKELFDSLTELKHWSYMTPEVLAHIVQDVKSDDVHQKIEKYKKKLSTFKANTKLRDLIDISFPVPDYCIELTMEVEGWEDKTIEGVEKMAVNLMRNATHDQNVHLGWKKVTTGSLKITFILTESIKIGADITLEDLKKSGVVRVQIDGDSFCSEHHMKTKVRMYRTYVTTNTYTCQLQAEADNREMLPSRLWYKTGTTNYGIGGDRDVLLIASDLPHHQSEAVARRPGQLTEEDKQKLLNQGVSPYGQDEAAIVKARYELDRGCKIVGVMSGQLSREEVLKSIRHSLTTTQNDGGKIHCYL